MTANLVRQRPFLVYTASNRDTDELRRNTCLYREGQTITVAFSVKDFAGTVSR